MKLSERMYNAIPKKSHDMGDVFFTRDVDGCADEVAQLEEELDAYKDVRQSLLFQKEQLEAENAALKRDYYELIMSVSQKHEGETRHQTAHRYILEAEQSSLEASAYTQESE